MNGGAPSCSSVPASRVGSGPGTFGIFRSESSGASHATENADSTSAISVPSCSMRAESVLSERPSRSTRVWMLTGPGSGARG